MEAYMRTDTEHRHFVMYADTMQVMWQYIRGMVELSDRKCHIP